jgi:type IV secretory pathway VirB10-like protein
MSETPRVKVIGLVVGVAVVALAAGFFLLSRGQSSSSAASTHTVIPLSQRKHAKTAKPKHRAKPAKKPTTKPARKHPANPPATPPPPPAAEQDGLPWAVTSALERSSVVVVSLYAPSVELDDMALQEAKAGASAAGAGFVAINVLSEAESRPLTRQLGVLEDPGVLVFRRPGDLVTRFSGYADKQTILQAARNAGL